MTDDWSDRQAACAAELRRLLEGPYRHIWLRSVSRTRGVRINFSAVAKVLARTAELDQPDGVHHRALRDRVRRAIGHDQLTAETVELFARAFGMRDRDADRLWHLLAGTRVVPEPRNPGSAEDLPAGGRREPPG